MSIDMNTLISQMIMFFVILGCGFIGAKLGLLKAEVIHGLSSLLTVSYTHLIKLRH